MCIYLAEHTKGAYFCIQNGDSEQKHAVHRNFVVDAAKQKRFNQNRKKEHLNRAGRQAGA